jgi:hypothetical protein
MHQHLSKLTGTLKQLSEPELEKLAAYLQSPYFEAPTGAFLLFQYLKKFHPHYDEKKTDPAVIEKKAPALGNQKKQANAGSDLLKAVEGFLAIEDFLASGTVGIHRLKAYKNHHLFDAAKKEHEHLLTELDQNPEQDFEVFYQRHLLTELAFAGFDAVLTRTSNNDLQPVTQTLDAFYALKKLRYQCELLNRQRVLGTAYTEETLIPLLEVLAPFNNEKNPYTFLFANVYQMLKAKTFEESDLHYQALNKFISENTYIILPQAIKDVISYITNNCQFWNNQGYKQAAIAALNGQELKIKYDVLLENGKIQPSDFRNIVSLAIITRKDENWIRKFIEGYSDRLPADHAETNKAFALAQYNYYIQDFDSAMPLFQLAQVKDEPIFNAIVRRWQFMCMYEQNPTNTNLLLDFLDAYEKYLQRNTASLHWLKDTFTKNIVFGRKLIKATDTTKKNDLREQLNTETYFTGKEWLLQQL